MLVLAHMRTPLEGEWEDEKLLTNGVESNTLGDSLRYNKLIQMPYIGFSGTA